MEKEKMSDDIISRQAAIDAIEEMQIPIMRSEFSDEQLIFTGMSEALAAIKELPSVQPEQRWIPCSERLPDNEKRVLCTAQSGEHFCVVPCLFIQHTRRWLPPEVYGNHDNVLAWMPLPEPWRGEEDGQK